jgi:AcrR family transcriptional regulator
MESLQESFGERRPRRDKRRERNRRLLLQATFDLMVEGGSGALTPTRITRRAGMHKPAFYAHFADLDACQRALAEVMLQRFYEPRMKARREAMARDPTDAAGHYAWHLETLRGAQGEERAFYRVLPQIRAETGAIGACARTIVDQVRRDWIETLWDLAIRYGVGAAHLREVEALAVALVEMALTSLVRVAQGEITDVEAEAARLQRYDNAIITAELRRMLGQEPIAPVPMPA